MPSPNEDLATDASSARPLPPGAPPAAGLPLPFAPFGAGWDGVTVQRRVQEILEAITDSFAVYDSGFRVVFANHAAIAPLGLAPADVVGRYIWDLVPQALGTAFHTELERAMRDRTSVSFEEFFPSLDRWFETHAYPLPSGGLAVYARDVTARRREQDLRARLAAHAALRAEVGTLLAQELDLRAVLQGCCEAVVRNLGMSFARIWLANAAGTHLELEASAGKYTHLDGAHARVPVGAYKIGRIAAERKAHLTNAVLDDERVSNKEWARREGMVSFAGYPLQASGRLIGVFAGFGTAALPEDTLTALASVSDSIAQGIERRRAEQRLAERARDLARSNAELEQFAYVASHDLQEPLRMVASYNQLLARRYAGKLDKDADEFISYAVEGATRMQRLINDLLAYSRVGTRGGAFVPVSMDKVLATARGNLGKTITEQGAEVTSDPLPEVTGDEGQLTQLLQNLLSNAVKFHGEAPPRVHVGVRRQADDWAFFVRDNGVGIEPQFFERIFVIFQRLHTRDRYPGTGIGLAICKKVVERHGGRIWVESQPGAGSTVWFTLPFVPPQRMLP
jgi:PAS domain S-box-containing protein